MPSWKCSNCGYTLEADARRMPTPTSAHHAKKRVNFWIIPVIHRIVLMKVPIIESVRKIE